MAPEAEESIPAGGEADIARVWERFTQTRDAEWRDRLIEHYMPLVWKNASRLAQRLPPSLHIDDLVNAGIIGLIDAINRFEPQREIAFATYCSRRICGAIYDELRELDWLPRSMRRQAKDVENARSELTARLGRPPSTAEIAETLAMSPTEVETIQQATGEFGRLSLEQEIEAGDAINRAGDLMPSAVAEDPLKEITRRELKEMALRGLSEMEKTVLTLYYYEELEMREIAAVLGISESRVCQLHAQILKFLRSKFERLRVTAL